MDDVIYQSQLLQWAGISFNNLEWYKLKQSIDVIEKCNFIETSN